MIRSNLLLAGLAMSLALPALASDSLTSLDLEAGVGLATHYYRVQENYEQITETGRGPVIGVGVVRSLSDRLDAGLWVHGSAMSIDDESRDPRFLSLQVALRGRWFPGGGPVWFSFGGGFAAGQVERDAGIEERLEYSAIGWVATVGAGARLGNLAGRPVGLSYELRAVDIKSDPDRNTGGDESYLHTMAVTCRAFSL